MAEVTFGERLRAIRQGRLVRSGPEIGVRELARCTGISNTALSEAENGKGWVGKLPSLEILEALAVCLEVTIPELVGRPVAGMPDNGTRTDVHGVRGSEAEAMTDVQILRAVLAFVTPRLHAGTVEGLIRIYKLGGAEALQQIGDRVAGPWNSNLGEVVRGFLETLEAKEEVRIAREELEALRRRTGTGDDPARDDGEPAVGASGHADGARR